MTDKPLNIAVIGASGVLGRALLPMLHARGHSVRAISRHPTAAAPGIEGLALDLVADDAEPRLAEALRGCTAAIHAATAIPRDFTAPGAWDRNTRIRVEGTRRLLAACAAAGVQRYVQQSIVMAYPDRGDAWIFEDTALDTAPARADVCGPVIAMEAQVRAVPAATLAWTIVRGGAFVGPGTAQDKQIADVRRREAHIVAGGRHFVPAVHVDDMARAVLLAIEQDGHGRIINACAEPVRQRDYLEELARRLGAPPPPSKPDARPPQSWRCSSAAARRELGWTAERSIWPAG